jgi:hypothetical protein
MTIEEKRRALEERCYKTNCEECPLEEVVRNSTENCYTEPANVERNYAVVFGGENKEPAVDKLTRHEQICDEIKALYKRKNADYGDSFHKTFVEEGMAMPRIRLTDKLERFKKLTKSGEQNVNDESVRDTLIDLANYAIMTVLELEG